MDNTYEIFRGGTLTSVQIKDLEVGDCVMFKLHRRLVDEKSGKDIINSTIDMFFTPRELKDFFAPIVNDLKERIENADSIQERERV